MSLELPSALCEQRLPACHLIGAGRMDLVVKRLYALDRLGRSPCWLDLDIRALYRKHIIIRTGGIEQSAKETKFTVEHYVNDFDALIDSMAKIGFDSSHPVVISCVDDLPRDGAHRIATASALGLEVSCHLVDLPGHSWSMDWFEKHGFTSHERDMIIRGWIDLHRQDARIAILWPTVKQAWSDIEESLSAHTQIVTSFNLSLPKPGFKELVRDVYSFGSSCLRSPAIERKLEGFSIHPPEVRIVVLKQLCPEFDLKRRIRATMAERVGAEPFSIVHMSDGPEETEHLVNIIAHSNNLKWLQHRPELDASMETLLDNMRQIVTAYGVPAKDCCVVGGSVPAAFGLRPADDVDFTVTTRQREEVFGDGITKLSSTADVVRRGYARSFTGEPPCDDDSLIDLPSLHFFVRGIRFADPSIVLTRKQVQRRPKDLTDTTLLGALIGRAAGPASSNMDRHVDSAQIAIIQRYQGELKKISARLAQIEGSRSWRLLGIARRLKALARKLSGRHSA